jgi:hypothetical protein
MRVVQEGCHFNGHLVVAYRLLYTRAPVVLSHWDWDHLHFALRPEGRYLKDSKWIVPIQKLGPGAARFANEHSKSGRLGWKASGLNSQRR